MRMFFLQVEFDGDERQLIDTSLLHQQSRYRYHTFAMFINLGLPKRYDIFMMSF